jgi:cbb3-type cytochrome oxidase maturation protein
LESLYLLVPLSVVLVFGALWLFFRASDSGQFDDLVGPALRVLQDDDRVPPPACSNDGIANGALPGKDKRR